MKIKNNLSIRAIIYSISKILILGINMIVAPVFTRLLTTSEYGKVSIYSSWISIISIFVGVQSYATINNAKIEYSDKVYKKYCSSILFLSFLSFVLLLVFVFGLGLPIFKSFNIDFQMIIILLGHAYGSFCASFLSAYFTANKTALRDLVLSVGISISGFVLSLLIMKYMTDKVMGRIYGMAIPYLIISLFVMIYFWCSGNHFITESFGSSVYL